MNIISVHSHKGGVGKSTFTQFLAKYLAQLKLEQTCLIDLDLLAQGIRSTNLGRDIQYSFTDFLLADGYQKEEILEKMIAKHEKIGNLFFIVNRLNNVYEATFLKKMYIKLANEIYTGEITDNLQQLIKYLKKSGFQNIIIDLHPGLVLLSGELIREVDSIPVFITTANIVSFIGLFKHLLLRTGDWDLKLSELKIIVNRVPDDFVLEKLLENFMESEGEITYDEKLVCTQLKEKLTQQINSPLLIRENEEIRNMDTLINPKTLLSMEIPDDLKLVIDNIRENIH
jgi:cellulose biosynthesis protein BcsQ